MKKYNHKKIEKKWQKFWEKENIFHAKDFSEKPKLYLLIEFPYPSGEGLHVGHPRSYTALDIVARKKRMEGYNVLYPIGFDSFGLPAENYAIKTAVHPKVITKKNIKNFTRQLKSFGFSFDWSRAFSTTDPEYYRWTQWIFLQFFRHGMAYKAKIPINWCPSCKIGLANEEVVEGKCERCGNAVERREKEQWMLKITRYAQRLIDDLRLVNYIEPVKQQQMNWIGRSEGAKIKFLISSSKFLNKSQNLNSQINYLEVFTTRPDTLFGATFMVIAPEHKIITNYELRITNYNEVRVYIERAKRKSDLERTEPTKEKTGVELKGIKAVNPANGKEIPIFVADYVLMSYGTGAIMGVPAHDQRDFAFAKKYGLPVVEVIRPVGAQHAASLQNAYEDIEGGTLINSSQFNGLSVKEAMPKIIQWLEEKKLGKKEVQYKLRDWVFSRQRYWGEPIPLIFCEKCKKQAENQISTRFAREARREIKYQKLSDGEILNPGWIAVSENELPVVLPNVKKYIPSDTGESPLSNISSWVKTKCPRCGGAARRETDVMPNWAGSNWYYLRYCDPRNNQLLADPGKLKYWMGPSSAKATEGSQPLGGVDWYNGGMEHTTLHLLYSRFVYKFLWDIGAVPKECGPEPYRRRTSHGLILGEGGEKMSKSRGNVVNPDDIVEEFGADVLRLYEMFIGPFDQPAPWSTQGILGVKRFLDRMWKYGQEIKKTRNQENKKSLLRLMHQTIKKAGEDIEQMKFNTAVSALMIYFNEIEKEDGVPITFFETFLLLLSPFAPHITEELWEKLGHKKNILLEGWPKYDEKVIQGGEFQVVVQVDGRLRGHIQVAADVSEKEILRLALESDNVKKFVEGKKIVKTIYVPKKILNIVT